MCGPQLIFSRYEVPSNNQIIDTKTPKFIRFSLFFVYKHFVVQKQIFPMVREKFDVDLVSILWCLDVIIVIIMISCNIMYPSRLEGGNKIRGMLEPCEEPRQQNQKTPVMQDWTERDVVMGQQCLLTSLKISALSPTTILKFLFLYGRLKSGALTASKHHKRLIKGAL